MAFSDVLQFNCSIDNEIARNALKDFTGMLGKAFEQYKRLWNEYLQLRKHCEEAAFNIPFQLLESDEYNKDNNNTNTKETQSRFSKEFTSSDKSVYTSYNADVNSDMDETFYSVEKPMKENTECREILSPILIKKHLKVKRANSTSDESILNSHDDNINVPIFANNLEDHIVAVEPKIFECSVGEYSDNEVTCTPVNKVQKKLIISNLHNVDNTLCSNGKRLRESANVFLPNAKSADTATYKKHARASPLKLHVSPKPKKKIIGKSNNSIPLGEDIIEGSPNKHLKSNLKLKRSKIVKKSPMKFPENYNKRKNEISGALNIQNTDSNLAVREKNQTSLSQYLLHTSIQKTQPIYNESAESNSGFCSPCIVTHPLNECSFLDDTGNVTLFNETRMAGSTGDLDSIKVDTKKFKETENQVHDNSSRCSDETFYQFDKNEKENCDYKMNEPSSLKKDVFENHILPQYLSVKKNLNNSFDRPPEKKEMQVVKSLKTISERTKMAGVSCWECKQYYAGLGLSNEEIKGRQNHCSRHRMICTKRSDTPDGFWHPLFPPTCSNTFQGD